MFKRMFFGEVIESVKGYSDMNAREVFYMLPLCATVSPLDLPVSKGNIMKASVGSLVDLMAKFQ